jgi:hypothetical protein
MKYYEYDAQGYLVGWYEAETARPFSTPILPLSPATQSRWVNGAWTLDPSREQQQAADELDARTGRQQAVDLVRAYDPDTATPAQVRSTLGATIFLLKSVILEIR